MQFYLNIINDEYIKLFLLIFCYHTYNIDPFSELEWTAGSHSTENNVS